MTQWVFDLGNSRMKCAPLQADGRLGEVRALGYGDDVAGALDDAVPAAVTGEAASAVLASVASPARTAAAVDWLTRRFGCISIVRTQPTLAGVRIAYADPARLGVDRFLALLAAHHVRKRQAHLLARSKSCITLVPKRVLPDGSFVATLRPSPKAKKEERAQTNGC